MSTKQGEEETFRPPENAGSESETGGGPGPTDGGAAFNALGEEILQGITEGPRLCPSRLPEHTNSAWRKRIMRGTGAKARMRENRPEGSFAVSVDERYGNGNFEAIDDDSEAYCWRRSGFFWCMRASLGLACAQATTLAAQVFGKGNPRSRAGRTSA